MYCLYFSGLPPPVVEVPYFRGTTLLTAASLNGGDAFHSFIIMLTKWTQKFADDVTADDVYEKLFQATEYDNNGMLCILLLFKTLVNNTYFPVSQMLI